VGGLERNSAAVRRVLLRLYRPSRAVWC